MNYKDDKESNQYIELKHDMIDRLIYLSDSLSLPGFEGNREQIHNRFMNMQNDLFITMYELIVIQAHKEGHQ